MNRSTRILVVIMGILTGLSAIPHGISEILQGSKPTTDIGVRIGAFSVIPDYLLTGIAAIITSLLIIFWSIRFIHKKYGPWIYLLLSIILFLAGGGVAFVLLALLTWSTGTRINKPLSLWKKIMPDNLRRIFARVWLPLMIASFLFLSAGIGIWLFLLPPGEIRQVTPLHYICWSSLIAGLILLVSTIIFGFARDIELQKKK